MPFVFISPVRLMRTSFLAGSIFALAFLLLLVDLAILALRGYAFSLVSGWAGLDSVIGLDGIRFSLLVAIVWYCTLVFLLLDLVFTRLLPSRDLETGAVVSFGIIGIMQVPLVVLWLKYELSWSNQVWLINACNLADHTSSCTSWFRTVSLISTTTSSISCGLHLAAFLLSAWYVHTRPATSQDLLAEVGKREKSRTKGLRRRSKTQKRKAAGSDSEEGLPLTQSGSRPTPTSYAPPAPPTTFHTDSDSDVEKAPLTRQ
ncbi:hypothetical protein JCM8097_004600 [Rhodosporidiobolus ruineniae]